MMPVKKKSRSLLRNSGLGFAGDILLFAAVILVMSLLSIASFSSAYLITLTLILVVVLAYFLYNRLKKTDS